jgi:E3 ubiquitin-protein ligase HUWE1
MDSGLGIIPGHVFEQLPAFWSIIQKHSQLFDRLIVDSEDRLLHSELRFFKDYPEVLRLNPRIRLFRTTQQAKIQDTQISLSVRRSDILADSFARLAGLRGRAFLGRLHVQFFGEMGINAGGLTRDWFATLVRAIFNPNFTLFIAAANGRSSQLNPLARNFANGSDSLGALSLARCTTESASTLL